MSKRYPGFPPDPQLDGLPRQRRYVDEPTSETTNDVCIRWNAPLVYMAAFLTRDGECRFRDVARVIGRPRSLAVPPPTGRAG